MKQDTSWLRYTPPTDEPCDCRRLLYTMQAGEVPPDHVCAATAAFTARTYLARELSRLLPHPPPYPLTKDEFPVVRGRRLLLAMQRWVSLKAGNWDRDALTNNSEWQRLVSEYRERHRLDPTSLIGEMHLEGRNSQIVRDLAAAGLPTSERVLRYFASVIACHDVSLAVGVPDGTVNEYGWPNGRIEYVRGRIFPETEPARELLLTILVWEDGPPDALLSVATDIANQDLLKKANSEIDSIHRWLHNQGAFDTPFSTKSTMAKAQKQAGTKDSPEDLDYIEEALSILSPFKAQEFEELVTNAIEHVQTAGGAVLDYLALIDKRVGMRRSRARKRGVAIPPKPDNWQARVKKQLLDAITSSARYPQYHRQ